MKPDWDKLMAEYADSATALVADVDCTAAGKDLCQKIGVQGYPTIKYGDPDDLADYQGGRSLDDLQKFAKENLVPLCNAANIDLCDDDKKAKLTELMAKSQDELDTIVSEGKAAIEAAEKTFQTILDGLNKTYEEISKAKEAGDKTEEEFNEELAGLRKTYGEADEAKNKAVKAVKDGDYGLAKGVAKHMAAQGKQEL